MDVIFITLLQICICQKCVPVAHTILGYHTVNIYYIVAKKCPGFSIPCQDINIDATNTCSTIRFHIYRYVSFFTDNDICPCKERKICSMCSTGISSVTPWKVCTQKELVLLETLISEFHHKYYIPEIQKLSFHFPDLRIHGTLHCGKELHESFKLRIKQHGF